MVSVFAKEINVFLSLASRNSMDNLYVDQLCVCSGNCLKLREGQEGKSGKGKKKSKNRGKRNHFTNNWSVFFIMAEWIRSVSEKRLGVSSTLSTLFTPFTLSTFSTLLYLLFYLYVYFNRVVYSHFSTVSLFYHQDCNHYCPQNHFSTIVVIFSKIAHTNKWRWSFLLTTTT